MVKGGNGKAEDSKKPKPDIIEKGIVKKNGKGKKLEGVVEALSSAAASGSDAPKKGISGNNDEFEGYIFLCNGRTKPECFSYRVFGLPSNKIDIVARIKPNTKLFLFDFDVKLLYGVYSATSTGTMNLEQHAFGGRFPAQVGFEIFKECTPIPESKFKNVIKDNYQGSKFRQNLSADQVDGLIALFRPLTTPQSASPAPTHSIEIQSRKILLQEMEKQSRSPASLFSNEYQSRKILLQEIEKQSRIHTSLLSNENQSRKIFDQEIEKQRRSPSISVVSQQAPGSHYNDSRFGLSSLDALPVSMPLSMPSYNTERPLTSLAWGPEQISVPSQLYPLSRVLPYDNLDRPEVPRHSYFTEYPGSISDRHRLSSGYPNAPLISGIEVNHHMGMANDYYIYQNQNSGQSLAPQQIPQPTSASYSEPNKAPSSVLAAAYWVAVANEIPQSGVHHASDSGQSETGQHSNSLQYKPPNLSSQSLLDAYWEAKALEDSRQAHPGSSYMLSNLSQQPMSNSQGSVYPISYSYSDQNHQLHPHYFPAPSSQGGSDVFASSNFATADGSQVAAYPSGIQQQGVYNPTEIQMQHDPRYYSTYTL